MELAKQTGANTILGGDMGCLLNISGRLSRLGEPIRVYHVAEVLANMAEGPGIAQVGHSKQSAIATQRAVTAAGDAD
jgi:hypothetical protein